MVKSRQLFSAGEWDDVLTACFSWARCPFKWLTLTIAWKRRHYQRQGQSDVALSGYQQSTGPSAQFNRVREKSAHPNILTFHGMKAFRVISASDPRLPASKRDAVPRAFSPLSSKAAAGATLGCSRSSSLRSPHLTYSGTISSTLFQFWCRKKKKRSNSMIIKM